MSAIKTITICGSMSFFENIKEIKKELETFGYVVHTPSPEGTGADYAKLPTNEIANLKQYFIDRHIEKIKASDAILIANYDKNNTKGYIGANSFLEMGIAYALGKKIFLLNGIPDQPNTAEMLGLKPTPLRENISNIC